MMAKSKKTKTQSKPKGAANKVKTSGKKNAAVALPKDPIAQSAQAFYDRGDFAALRKIAKSHPGHETVKTLKSKADTETPVWIIGLIASSIVLCAAALTLTTG